MSDPEKTYATKLGVLNARGMSSRWTYFIGKDGKVLYVDKKVKAGDHGESIAAKLKELGVAEKK